LPSTWLPIPRDGPEVRFDDIASGLLDGHFSKPVEAPLDAVLNGRYKVDGVGLNFLTKVLAVHDPLRFTVFNQPIAKTLEHFKYERTRGHTPA
jgi:hypothetical protein